MRKSGNEFEQEMEENISNVVSGASPIVNSKKVVGRKQDRDTALGVFTSETERHGASLGDRNTYPSEQSRHSLSVTRELLVSPTASDSGTGTPGPSKSPARKPMPINEPKPILPKSKQIDLSAVAAVKEKILANEENNQSEKKRIVRVRPRENMESPKRDQNDREDQRLVKRSSSPMSPSLKSKNRPSTLVLDKREKFKRCSALSVTPSTDSNKSSKTFEFPEYDEETKEKILEKALKEEDEFLEFVKTLDLEPPDPIIEAGKEVTKKKQAPTRVQESRGHENLESLCRLMEEISVLKDQNTRLTERLNYMEVEFINYMSIPYFIMGPIF